MGAETCPAHGQSSHVKPQQSSRAFLTAMFSQEEGNSTGLTGRCPREAETLLIKARLVKAMVFPVVMYACESRTIKKAESPRLDALNCGVGADS